MSILEIFTQTNVLAAIVVVTGLSLIEPLACDRLARRNDTNPAWVWSFEHVVTPLFRAVLVVVFVVIAYPSVFGLYAAPPLDVLVDVDADRMSRLVGLLFGVSLLVPLADHPLTRPAIVLPLQSVLATGTVFLWLKDYLGITVATLWPGAGFVALILVLSFTSHRLVVRAAALLGRHYDDRFAVEGSAKWLARGLEPWAQIPTIVFYGAALGLQLAP